MQKKNIQTHRAVINTSRGVVFNAFNALQSSDSSNNFQ